MDDAKVLAERCLKGAEEDAMNFPEIVALLLESGFESYVVDLRRGRAIYYLPDGDSVELSIHQDREAVATSLDKDALAAAIREAQALAADYTYKGFCAKAKRAGCAGYMVSFPGRRAVYFGRNGDIHVEHFPT
jgi:uncharacterized protein YbcV (DUF1398 family)